MKTDIEIAQEAVPEHILRVAERAGLSEDEIEYYGKYKAKIDLAVMNRKKADGKLVLVTAITPTPAGEGKTTTTIGLADGMRRIGKNVVVALREPSLGPVFGVKGGAAGGGYAQVIPMEDEYVWLDAGNAKSMLQSAQTIHDLEDKGYYVGVIEEIAYREGWISAQQLHQLGQELSMTEYGQHLLSL